MELMKKVDSIMFNDNYISIIVSGIEMRIFLLEDDIVRLRVNFNDEWSEKSYSLSTTYWEDELDELFKNERTRKELNSYTYTESNEKCKIESGNFNVEIQYDPFIIKFVDKDGEIIYESIKDIGFYKDNNRRVKNKFRISEKDNFYGFGEDSGKLNKKDSYVVLNPMDAMGYDPKNTKTLYKHIPFFIKLNSQSQKSFGFFYHNTYRQVFDLGREKSNYWAKHATYTTDGGDIDIFIINGPKVKDVIKRYTDLTGKSALLPKQALGYLASSMYYSELEKDCDEKIIDFIDKAKNNDIPIDGFQLSSGYCTAKTEYGNKRCVFTWNEERFPNPKRFFEQMEERGIRVSPNIKPGILTVHPNYDEFKTEGIFVKDKTAENPAIGTWWGGDGSFVDYTNGKTREYWKSLLKNKLFSEGVNSVWNDNCEYDGLFDDDSITNYEGESSNIDRNRVIMSNIMCKITNDAIEEYYPNKRPFTVCRSGHAGIQKYAQTWSGDNYTSWDSLKYNVSTILGMGLSGVSNYGADVGGFYGPAPDEELFIRWVQNGIFFPRFSIHSTNTDNTVTEPWMYYKTKNIISDAIKLRYRLSPYYYSLMYRSSVEGIPILQPLFSVFQDDENTYNECNSFMVGDSLLVSTVINKNEEVKEIYFPKGCKFFDINTKKEYKGGKSYKIDVDITSIPMFIKEGGIIVSSGNQLYNLKNDKIEKLLITIANGKDGKFVFYDDDGESFDYKQGNYISDEITLESGEKTLIKFRRTGDYKSTIKSIEIDLINKEKSPFYIMLDGERLEQYLDKNDYEQSNAGWYYDHMEKSVKIKYNSLDKNYDILVSFEEFDLVGM